MLYRSPPKECVTNSILSTEITLSTTGVEHSSCLTEHNNTAKSFKKGIEWEYSLQKKQQQGFKKTWLQSLNLEWGQGIQAEHFTPFQFFPEIL